jgi:hypothetical protein
MAVTGKGPTGPTIPKISIKSGGGGSGWVDEEPSHLPGNQTRHKALPDIHFGEVSDDDDELPNVKGHNDDNDAKQDKTDQDVIDILGFDPLEFDTDDDG